MGFSWRCARCNSLIWLNYYKTAEKSVICMNCGNKEKEHEKQQRTQDIKQKLSGDAYRLFYNFVEKYRGNPPAEELKKLIDLLDLKYQIYMSKTDFYEIEDHFLQELKKAEGIKNLEEFEKGLLGKTEYVHKQVDALTNQNDNVKYYCTICNTIIDKKNFDLTTLQFGKPLCQKHQGTPYQRKLFEALKQRGIECEYEAFDGFKHVDIAIPKARLYIEIDGEHHITDPTQLDKDLWRDEYSSKAGYRTIHYSNKQIADSLSKIADALTDVIKSRQNNTFIN